MDNSEWPFWMTFGGQASAWSATGSDLQSWIITVESFVVWILCGVIGIRWFRDAGRAQSWKGRRVKIDLALQYLIGGFAVGGLRIVMTWFPLWFVFHAVMFALTLLLVKDLIDRRGLSVTFSADKGVIEKARLVAQKAAEIAPYARRSEEQVEVFRHVAELRAMLDQWSLPK